MSLPKYFWLSAISIVLNTRYEGYILGLWLETCSIECAVTSMDEFVLNLLLCHTLSHESLNLGVKVVLEELLL